MLGRRLCQLGQRVDTRIVEADDLLTGDVGHLPEMVIGDPLGLTPIIPVALWAVLTGVGVGAWDAALNGGDGPTAQAVKVAGIVGIAKGLRFAVAQDDIHVAGL